MLYSERYCLGLHTCIPQSHHASILSFPNNNTLGYQKTQSSKSRNLKCARSTAKEFNHRGKYFSIGGNRSSTLSAPPLTTDLNLESVSYSKSFCQAVIQSNKELKNPFIPKKNDFENKHQGKQIELTPIVLVGDSGCGKTSLIMTYFHKRPIIAKKSELFETYDKVINFNNVDTSIKLQIWDFPGNEYFDRFRPLGYANAQGVIICFNIDQDDSFNNIRERWVPELSAHCPKVFKIMVGISSESRINPMSRSKNPSFDQCYKFAKTYGYKYIESFFGDQRSCATAFEQMAYWAIDDLTKKNKANKTPIKSRQNLKSSRPEKMSISEIAYLSPFKSNNKASAFRKTKDVKTQKTELSQTFESDFSNKESCNDPNIIDDQKDSGNKLKKQTSYRKHKEPKCEIM